MENKFHLNNIDPRVIYLFESKRLNNRMQYTLFVLVDPKHFSVNNTERIKMAKSEMGHPVHTPIRRTVCTPARMVHEDAHW